MKPITLNRQVFWSLTARVKQAAAELPYSLLIERFMLVRLVLLGVLLLGALGMVLSLLYVGTPADEASSVARPLLLQTDSIDELEVWLEDRQAERERTIVNPAREYFKL